MKKKTALNIFDDNALLYEQKYMETPIYDASYREFLNGITNGGSILELGCGPGNITRFMHRERPDLNLLATDFSEEMIRLARKNVPDAEFQVMDAKEVLAISSGFDGIVCGFIAPYLTKKELIKLLSDCKERLKDNGRLYLSAIEGEYEKSDWMESSDGKSSTFVYLYSEDDLRRMLDKHFTDLQMFRIPGDPSHLIFLATL